MAYLFIVVHVLFVSLLHHLPLPSLLLQSLLDELRHFTLLPRLLSANYKPGKHSKPVSQTEKLLKKKTLLPPASYVNLKHTHTRHPQNLKNIPRARIQVGTSDKIGKINKHTLTQTACQKTSTKENTRKIHNSYRTMTNGVLFLTQKATKGVCVRDRVCVGPDGAAGVAQDGGGQALSDTDQAGSIYLHDQIVHLDPAQTHTHTHRHTNSDVSVVLLTDVRGYCGCESFLEFNADVNL